MKATTTKRVTSRYCARFGQIAVEMGCISETQLKQALCQQVDDDLSGREHRLLGTILFDNDWMTGAQIETVLNITLKKMREEASEYSASESTE